MAKRKTNKKAKYSEADMFALLRKRYTAPAWATLPQVPDATGTKGTRYADAISMSLWPSRGLELHGFEIKCTRSDWNKELKSPQKAETIAAYCHRWWVVAPSTKIVPVDELPPNWGLLVISGRGLKQAKGAAHLKAKPLTYEFLAGLLRRAEETREGLPSPNSQLIPAGEIQDQLDKKYEAGKTAGYRKAELEFGSARRLKKAIEDFEEVSGIKITAYNGEYLGDAVKAIQEMKGAKQTIEQARKRIETMIEVGNEMKEELEDLWD